MLLNYHNFTIRNATTDDACLLASWWNDGKEWQSSVDYEMCQEDFINFAMMEG